MADADDVPTLSAETLAVRSALPTLQLQRLIAPVHFQALQEFLKEKAEQELRESTLAENAQEDPSIDSIEFFVEDWQLSQFWYSAETCDILAKELIDRANGGRIACVCTPSAFVALVRKLSSLPDGGTKPEIFLFEYDKRFAVYGRRFVFYDYNDPLAFPAEFQHSFDAILADPPFLNKKCWSKVTETVKALRRNASTSIIVNTGAIMTEFLKGALNAQPCKWRPRHARNLSNEFLCFTNYPSTTFGGWA